MSEKMSDLDSFEREELLRKEADKSHPFREALGVSDQGLSLDNNDRFLHGIYVIYDSIGETYSSPYTANNSMVAVRNFEQALKNVSYPGDFVLQKVGSFDSLQGRFKTCEPVVVMEGAELLETVSLQKEIDLKKKIFELEKVINNHSIQIKTLHGVNFSMKKRRGKK